MDAILYSADPDDFCAQIDQIGCALADYRRSAACRPDRPLGRAFVELPTALCRHRVPARVCLRQAVKRLVFGWVHDA